MKYIEYKGRKYPYYQAEGNAARWVKPFAQEWCKGIGLDIGYGKDEWKLEGAIGVDLKDGYDAMHLPHVIAPYTDAILLDSLDYIFSSHCLEHLQDWVGALDHWLERLKKGGILFLYLPHYSQEYWRPWNNRKHIHVLNKDELFDYAIDRGAGNIFFSGVDLNNSFIFIIEK